MSAYYNEVEPYAAQWLRNLIAAGHIAPGDVDERSIEDVCPDDLRSYTQCHFFAGIGIWSLALRRAGWPDSRPVWTGSCPCQPFSTAGAGTGFDDERHLWPDFHWLIQQCGPTVVFGEQVASAPKWLGLVRSDLVGLGYAVGAIPIEAACAGSYDLRDRFFFVADANGVGRIESGLPPAGGHSEDSAGAANIPGHAGETDWLLCLDGFKRPVEAGTFPLGNGDSRRVGRLRAYGNAINAKVATKFITAYMDTRP